MSIESIDINDGSRLDAVKKFVLCNWWNSSWMLNLLPMKLPTNQIKETFERVNFFSGSIYVFRLMEVSLWQWNSSILIYDWCEIRAILLFNCFTFFLLLKTNYSHSIKLSIDHEVLKCHDNFWKKKFSKFCCGSIISSKSHLNCRCFWRCWDLQFNYETSRYMLTRHFQESISHWCIIFIHAHEFHSDNRSLFEVIVIDQWPP